VILVNTLAALDLLRKYYTNLPVLAAKVSGLRDFVKVSK
jgi:hypothetical protein